MALTDQTDDRLGEKCERDWYLASCHFDQAGYRHRRDDERVCKLWSMCWYKSNSYECSSRVTHRIPGKGGGGAPEVSQIVRQQVEINEQRALHPPDHVLRDLERGRVQLVPSQVEFPVLVSSYKPDVPVIFRVVYVSAHTQDDENEENKCESSSK